MNKITKFVSAGIGMIVLLAILVSIPGVTIDIGPDVICSGMPGSPCYGYFNVTSKNVTVTLRSTTGIQLEFDKEPNDHALERWNGTDWIEETFAEDFDFEEGIVYQFRVVVEKEPWQRIKWGVTAGSAYADPVFFEDYKLEGETFEKNDSTLLISGNPHTCRSFPNCFLKVDITNKAASETIVNCGITTQGTPTVEVFNYSDVITPGQDENNNSINITTQGYVSVGNTTQVSKGSRTISYFNIKIPASTQAQYGFKIDLTGFNKTGKYDLQCSQGSILNPTYNLTVDPLWNATDTVTRQQLNETYRDNSGNGNDFGTIAGSPTFNTTSFVVGNASYSGDSGKAAQAYNHTPTGMVLGNTNWTAGVFVNYGEGSVNAGNKILRIWGFGDNENDFSFGNVGLTYLNDSPPADLRVGGRGYTKNTDIDLNHSVWSSIVITYNASDQILTTYVNGDFMNAQDIGTNLNICEGVSDSTCEIGLGIATNDHVTAAAWTDGIDDFRFNDFVWNITFIKNYHNGSKGWGPDNLSDMPAAPAPPAPDNEAPNITLNHPVNETQFNDTNVVLFNWSATDDLNVSFLCDLQVNGTVLSSNITQNNTATYFSSDTQTYGNTVWFVNCTDNASTPASNSSGTQNFFINDTIAPIVTLNAPANDSIVSTLDSTGNQTFSWTGIESRDATFNCTLYINDTAQSDNVTTNNTQTNKQNISMELGRYSWYINCTDEYGNTGFQGTQFFNITQTNESIISSGVNITNASFAPNSSNATFDFVFNSSGFITGIGNLTSWNNSVINQTSVNPSWNISTVGVTYTETNITINLTTNNGYNFRVVCGNTSSLNNSFNITSQAQHIMTIPNNTTMGIWCWGSYVNASIVDDGNFTINVDDPAEL